MTASSLYCSGQNADSVYAKRKVSKTDIQLVYSHYIQHGNHSAITGGTGTEKMTVFSPDITIHKQVDSLAQYSINIGMDVISSASTDKIDFVVSSASKTDAHAYLNFSYSKKIKRSGLVWGISTAASIESDYLSGGLGASVHHTNRDKSRELSAEIETFFDDLRWGRLNGVRPLKLVYPQELRNIDWFKIHNRKSFNLNLSWQQTINKKLLLAIFPNVVYQKGLLSTPFHRIYFADGSERVENLPQQRWKFPLGVQLNSFLGNRTFLRSYYRFYIDDFGILANTFELELPVKISPFFTLSPSLRFYTQQGSLFFKPYREHSSQQRFYTSDYDLSGFNSYEAGIETKLIGAGKNPGSTFNNFGVRYSFYSRDDGLKAHTITLLLDFFAKKKRIDNLSSL